MKPFERATSIRLKNNGFLLKALLIIGDVKRRIITNSIITGDLDDFFEIFNIVLAETL